MGVCKGSSAKYLIHVVKYCNIYRLITLAVAWMLILMFVYFIYYHSDVFFTEVPVKIKDPWYSKETINVAQCHIKQQTPTFLHNRWQIHLSKKSTEIKFRKLNKEIKLQSKQTISVYSAFYDRRLVPFLLPIVQVFGVSTVLSQNPKIFCQLWYSDLSSPRVMTAGYKVIGRGAYLGQLMVKEYLFTCANNMTNTVPRYVSLTFEKCENSTILLPVSDTEKTRKGNFSHQFGICVAVSYGDISPLQIIEWVEFVRLLGVTEINIYNSSLTDRTRRVFKHYQDEGVVRMFSAPPPVDSQSYWSKKLAVIAGLNDCMYRNMYRYEMLIVKDVDEVIVPHQHMNYSQMFQYFPAFHHLPKVKYHAYTFRNAYFFTNFPVAAKPRTNLRTISHRTRAEISRPGYSVKTITNPRSCLVMSNHQCIFNDRRIHKTARFSVSVKPTFALNQHYKRCHLGPLKCAEMLKTHHADDSALRFGPILEERYNHQRKIQGILTDTFILNP